ncbi:hypothetical protein MEO41_22265, partial [Dolichospermum sp. ST_sed4]|nr:hypothetical protein [Dolichospermum sp. ST_sed4]
NPGHPDSDKIKLPNTPQQNYQQHPVNPIILDILILTINKYQTPNRKFMAVDIIGEWGLGIG